MAKRRHFCPECSNFKGHAMDCPRNKQFARLTEGAEISGQHEAIRVSGSMRIEMEDGDWFDSGEAITVYRLVVETDRGDFLSKYEFATEEAAMSYGDRVAEAGEIDKRFWFQT